MNRPLLHLDSDYLYYSTRRLENPRHAVIPAGVTVVIGPNGAGKSMLADILERGRNFRTNRITTHDGHKPTVRKIEFADIHSLRGITAVGYYQQRYEATMNDDVPTVRDIITRNGYDAREIVATCETMGLHEPLDRRINSLSSGELRKLLVAASLTAHPDLLILDNPYIGLDTTSRSVLDTALNNLTRQGVSVMLLVCDSADIPPYANTIIPVSDMKIGEPVDTSAYSIGTLRDAMTRLFGYAIDLSMLPRPLAIDNDEVSTVVGFNNCRISYGDKTIVDSINWHVGDNERWALSGPNGSGKSTILSMINADNPAAYRSDITLFDRRRGTGESIWDIKRRIGYVSPEMRLYFTGNGSVVDVLGHGLVDTVGNFVKLRPDQIACARMWLELLHLENVADQRFDTLSAGQKQLILLARAMIKQPRLLILDEPMHGLDYGRKRAMRALVNHLAARADRPGSPYPMSMIYVTHCSDEFPECLDNIFTLPSRQS